MIEFRGLKTLLHSRVLINFLFLKLRSIHLPTLIPIDSHRNQRLIFCMIAHQILEIVFIVIEFNAEIDRKDDSVTNFFGEYSIPVVQ